MRSRITARIGQHLIDAIVQEADRCHPLETGGVFMGYWADDAAIIRAVIGPGPNARHERRNFEPDHEWQAAQIATYYEAAGRRETYLGDWHTHPGQKHAALSFLDRTALRKIITTPEARAPKPLMAIVAGTPNERGLAIWRGELVQRRVLWPRLLVRTADITIEGAELRASARSPAGSPP